ncbi:TPA: helix-turn-helix transcriptional regulator [Escherichia coli]|nr:helix-turn-helix transcriptional regulator [Escherichia coli]HBB1733481.1 helix-turn-helix transcriptional regulator [Escherichia coli]HCN5797292.1 helix-turn-helix transcriptional regulator [Escherichia coli]HCN9273323.1 helix-turn-helix transcriptional regulator [Escherichia coli]HDW1459435.1 helix-turn-helix transcriptional regulator [Escherichia coli]
MQSPLRNVRKAHGFTLQHVAAGVQVNPATLSRIERLEQIPSIELAERLANFFKGEVSEMQILYRGCGQRRYQPTPAGGH